MFLQRPTFTVPRVETFTDPSVFLKMLEFLLTLLAVSVEQGGQASFGSTSREFFGGGACVMSITITTLLFCCYAAQQQRDIQRTYFEFVFNGMSSLLLLTSGSLMIEAYSGSSGVQADHAYTAGAFCIINSFVYAVDCYFAIVNFRSMTEVQNQQTQQQPSQQVP